MLSFHSLVEDDVSMKTNENLNKLLNLNFVTYSNKTVSCGDFDLPALYCNTSVFPDYIALYNEKKAYHKTTNTAVSFYQFDSFFDGQNGLFWAIYFNNEKLLSQYKKRFNGVKFIITPDYSILGDVNRIENIHRIFRARIVALWFIFELNVIAIPNISFSDDETAKIALLGLEESSVVAMSTKGHMQEPAEKQRLKENVKFVVDTLNLKAIIVYDVCGTDDETKEVFSYATNKGIEIIIPDNVLKSRNVLRKERKAVTV